MPLSTMLLSSLLLMLAVMTGLWLLSLARRDASIVDPFWGMGFILVTCVNLAFSAPEHHVARSWLFAALTMRWWIDLKMVG